MIASDLLQFVRANTPTPYDVLTVGPWLVLWSVGSLALAAHLKHARGWRIGYTRKVFHFLTFAMAAALGSVGGSDQSVVCLFGGACSLVILYAVLRGDGHVLYEAIAREKDAPYRTWYIVIPYLATLIGGLTVSACFPRVAAIGLLVCGIGDAVGEPIGVRFGRHHYRVPLPGRVVTYRSLEGSFGVFVFSSLAALIGAAAIADVRFGLGLVGVACVLGMAAALMEAVAPHGFDNAVMIIAPAALAQVVL